MENILEPIKNSKNLKSLLTNNLLHRGPLKTTSGTVGWAALLYGLAQLLSHLCEVHVTLKL